MEFTYSGIKLHYEVSGEGEWVTLLHGWGGSVQSFLGVQKRLCTRFRVLNLDFPGFGASEEPNADWGVSEYARCVLALMDELGIASTALIAHSFGGRVALKIADLRPGIVSKQLLTGCAGLKDQQAVCRPSLASRLKKVYDNPLTRRVLGDGGVEKINNAVRSRFGSEDYKNASPRMREIFKKVIDEDLSYCLEKITCPTLLVWGEYDTATPLWMGRKMEQEIKDAALIVFEGGTHFAYIEQFARFMAIADSFLGA
ncbi:MAG: alpha/beta hydrolase [Clostridiales bacterium]|nr:alpha/beta hydrolase [Clostridiales bacterium]